MEKFIIYVKRRKRLIDYKFYRDNDENIVLKDLNSKGYKVLGVICGSLISPADKSGFYVITNRQLPCWYKLDDFEWKHVDHLEMKI